MGNFDFVRETIPPLHDDCARAESLLRDSPDLTCLLARRIVESLVLYLYDLIPLSTPYRDDLAARISDTAFRQLAGQAIVEKLHLIRRLGNTGAHAGKRVSHRDAELALRELFHVMVWVGISCSPAPGAVPVTAQFDSAMAARSAPLTRGEVRALADRFHEQDAAQRQELAARDERIRLQDAEIERLRARIAVAQPPADTHDYSEAETRTEFIDLLLREAGWPLDEPHEREYEVQGMPNEHGVGYVDYVLWGADGRPLALVEAKRTTKSPHVGQQQAKLYADCLEHEFGRRPAIFYTNGYEHWLWDDAAGYPPRQVQGFFTRDELERLIIRRGTSVSGGRARLTDAPLNTTVAGRPYQQRAIRAVDDAFDHRQRDALLVMATGSGKTRTVIALVEQLMNAGWAKRVLFLADRTALVRQATNAFREHLPSATTVNLLQEKNTDARVYVATYPTMLNLIEATTASGERVFGPGFFDLVVIDEAHRSVYAKYGAIFDWFDGLLVGLTATPKDEIDHNTYRLFHLEDGVPTDAYSLDEAVADGYLVPARGVSVGTKFLRQGIRYAELSEQEKDDWDALDWGEGEVPDEIDAEALNRFLFNEDTVDKVIETVMSQGHTVAGGDRLGKTIIFAKSQQHAEFIQRRFDLAHPEFAGGFARVITHAVPYADSLIDDFSDPAKAPHIAISVDMLDTGIDVPEVVNLVFFKLVRSQTKFWQMVGRGTRLCADLYGTGHDKADFLIFDFCGNLEFFSMELPGRETSAARPLSQRLFETRLALLVALDGSAPDRGSELRTSTAHTLHGIVAGMTLNNVTVRAQRRWVEQYSRWDAWAALNGDTAAEIAEHLATLPTTTRDSDEDAKRFDLVVLHGQLAQLEQDAAGVEQTRRTVQQLAGALLSVTSIPAVKSKASLLEQLNGDEWWQDATPTMLESVRLNVRSLVRFAPRNRRSPVYSDFEDQLGQARDIALPRMSAGTDWERFRAKAAAYLREHEDHLALQRLRRGKQLTAEDLASLGDMLVAAGVADRAALEHAAERSGGLGLFIRSLVGLDRRAATEAFARYLDTSIFTVDQIRFVELIITELTDNGVMEPARLFEDPYTDLIATGPTGLFDDADVEALATTIAELTARARPTDAA